MDVQTLPVALLLMSLPLSDVTAHHGEEVQHCFVAERVQPLYVTLICSKEDSQGVSSLLSVRVSHRGEVKNLLPGIPHVRGQY